MSMLAEERYKAMICKATRSLPMPLYGQLLVSFEPILRPIQIELSKCVCRKDVEREAERIGLWCDGRRNCAALVGRVAQPARAPSGDAEGPGEPHCSGS